MGRLKKKELLTEFERKDEDGDLSKPCSCGTGAYCHRHKRYGVDMELTPSLKKIKKSGGKAGPKYRPSSGGEY